MSHETYVEMLKRSGAIMDPARVDAFSLHRRDCPTCKLRPYAYVRCSVGSRLAREATRPA